MNTYISILYPHEVVSKSIRATSYCHAKVFNKIELVGKWTFRVFFWQASFRSCKHSYSLFPACPATLGALTVTSHHISTFTLVEVSSLLFDILLVYAGTRYFSLCRKAKNRSKSLNDVSAGQGLCCINFEVIGCHRGNTVKLFIPVLRIKEWKFLML